MPTRSRNHVTLSDIAREVDISVQVVSKVLNGGSSSTGASEATRERVLETAGRLGYRRNAAASALRSKRFHNIGLMMTGVPHSIYLSQRIVAAMARTLSDRDFTCSIVFTGPLTPSALQEQRLIRERMVDALVIGMASNPSPRFVTAVNKLGIPILWLHSPTRPNSISFNEADGVERLVEHLAERGHKEATYIDLNGRCDESFAQPARLKAFAQACEKHRLRPTIELDQRVDRPERPAFWKAWLERPGRPRAVIVGSCSAAMSLTGVAGMMGVRIPEDLAITTFDDGSHASANTPEITAAITPEEELGVAAGRLALSVAFNPSEKLTAVKLPFTLRVGQTT